MISLRALLTGLIDYAGTAPPAALSMDAAMHNYAAYRRGEHGWMLGRYILPLSSLADFERGWVSMPSEEKAGTPWRISLTVPSCTALDVEKIASFNARATAVVDAVEVKAENKDEIRQARDRLPEGITPYFEMATSIAADLIPALEKMRARAKVRTGGLTAQMFPPSADIVRFMSLCAAHKVAFKATAGLHHPLRSVHPFIPEPACTSGLMHGFVNVFLAAALIHAGGIQEQAVQTLDEESPTAFHFDDTGARWHNNRLTIQQLQVARDQFAVSFGSCSFEEPVNDLRGLGWL
jgi:hypothetical protein